MRNTLSDEDVEKAANTVETNAPLQAYLSQFDIDIPALCATVKHLRADAKSKKIELLQLSGRGELLAKEHVKFDELDEVAAVRNELDRLRNVVIPELQQHSERLTTGLLNIHHLITNEQCQRHVALGMATSAVSSLQSQLEQLRADLREQRDTIKFWQRHIQRMGQLLHCVAMDIDVEQAAKDLLARLAQVEQERDAMRDTLNALKTCQNKPVCGHCNALLRQYHGEM